MADDYYDGLEAEPAPSPKQADAKTTLLEKSVLGADVKPGDRVTLEIVRIFNDQVEARAVKEAPAETDELEPELESAPTFDEEIDSMATEMD
jgi:hypothetical protein